MIIQSQLSEQLERPQDNWIYLVSQDADYGDKLARQLTHFGYRLQVMDHLAKLENAVADHTTTAVLIDLTDLGEDARAEIRDYTRQMPQSSPPIFFLSDLVDQDLRLFTVRAGGQAFFTKPTNIISLVDQLDSICYSQEPNMKRVLEILSQSALASYYGLILERGGFSAQVVENLDNILDHLADFNPDLILMDIELAGVSSLELFKMIRQIDAYVSIPIVFLAGEADYEIQMELMKLGGDDFLIKPVRSTTLINTLENRLERSRVLRSMMVRDSLTGLLNHTNFRGQLNQEIGRSQRQGEKLSLAMLDLDEFKKVNDTYGHAVGDRVLKSLSRLLTQRLRTTDIIGRYGGEEFVASLLDATEDEALEVMDEIRQQFAQIQHLSTEGGRFSVTFSCGVASFPRYPNATVLSDAADRALYAAKAAGRDRVEIADYAL
jgi:diguanylate cyclase (GGDEF)-like protein